MGVMTGRPAAAGRIAAAAMYGGGGLGALGALGVASYGLLRAEAKVARRLIGNAKGTPPDSTGWYGRSRPGPALRIALLGDSSAAGYGVHRVEETPGAHLASGVSREVDRRVYLREVCQVGAQSSDLADQVERTLPMHPDIAVILIGANDVTHSVLPSDSVRHLASAVRTLRQAGVAVLVGTCPDLGTVRPIPQPLRQLVRAWSRRLAAAQTIVTLEEGGRTVSLATALGAEFDAAPALFFGPDRFHPSAAGYRALAGVLIPSVLAALGLREDEADELPTHGVLPLERAAVEAAKHTGTELEGTSVEGHERGVLGRWASLMHRRRAAMEAATTAPDEHEHEDEEEHA